MYLGPVAHKKVVPLCLMLGCSSPTDAAAIAESYSPRASTACSA